MNRISKLVLLAVALATVGCGGGSPSSPSAEAACANYDIFLTRCTACNTGWSCTGTYDKLADNEQIAIDVCTRCLANGCGDCAAVDQGVASCQAFMTSLLGVDCF
ncbi:MAG: hypothetical protein KC503_28170 [Myxococcales bacterium]|nr:hypothetical protein [Myxococcales bacterium]